MAMPLSSAGVQLGLGSLLQDQVTDETEELRRKRILEQQQRQQLGPAGLGMTGVGSSVASTLFGGVGGLGRGY